MADAAPSFGICLLSCALFFSAAQAGKILVIPVEGSHWINIKVLMMELIQRGHELTVIRPSNSLYIDETSEHFKVENVPMSDTQIMSRKEFEEYAMNWVFHQAFAKHSSSFSVAWEFIGALQTGTQMSTVALGAIFENKEVMERLTNAGFDLILADPYNVAGVMLAHHLKLPIVFFGRWMPTEDIHFAIAPSPLSYVPVINSRVTDKMAFHERVKNVALYYLYLGAAHLLIYPAYDKLAQRYLNTDIGVFEMYKRADIYLMKVDFVFEFPRPTMPNAMYIGGFQCRPPKPLPEDIQRFMDSSEQGVVVFSLGTIIKKLPLHIAREFAAGLAQLKERVIWRYSGEPLDTLGNNTMTVDWLPQNDLLSHPNTKVFLAHGGENGVYEALYHGVPIVGFPLFGDQYENLLRLKTRGAAVLLENLQDLTAKDIFDAVRTVIDDPSYSQAMRHLSELHRDTPVPPRDLAVFWTEFVMRHKGARHLQPAANDLAWYQYHLLDVTGFLLVTVFVSLCITIKIFRAVLRTFCCRKQNKQKQKKS
ncbi:UDP-glucuronosyltransferase 2A2-like [Rana temporaria]|uniref:UDP-glucuronosyltransferase 2A2-like n=1 Tax=Rana temporaria TaxID=8407 RepID=UPI001AADACFD|nr:UDP-glucuronosyltransferase 2A2-like [Rana temporaria]